MGFFDDWNNSAFGQGVNDAVSGASSSLRGFMTRSPRANPRAGLDETSMSDEDRHAMMQHDIDNAMRTSATAQRTLDNSHPNGMQEPAAPMLPTPGADVERFRQEQWKANAAARPAATAPASVPSTSPAPLLQPQARLLQPTGMRTSSPQPNFADNSIDGLQTRIAAMQRPNRAFQSGMQPTPNTASEFGSEYTALKNSLRRS